MPVRRSNIDKMRAAVNRLAAASSSGAVSVPVSVAMFAVEAGVSRATAYRGLCEIDGWQDVVCLRETNATPGTLQSQNHAVVELVPEKPHVLIREYRDMIDVMAQHIQALTLLIAERDAEIARLKGE